MSEYNIELSKDEFELLNKLVYKQRLSPKEIIRYALATENYFNEELSNGSTILILKSNGEIKEVFFR